MPAKAAGGSLTARMMRGATPTTRATAGHANLGLRKAARARDLACLAPRAFTARVPARARRSVPQALRARASYSAQAACASMGAARRRSRCKAAHARAHARTLSTAALLYAATRASAHLHSLSARPVTRIGIVRPPFVTRASAPALPSAASVMKGSPACPTGTARRQGSAVGTAAASRSRMGRPVSEVQTVSAPARAQQALENVRRSVAPARLATRRAITTTFVHRTFAQRTGSAGTR